MIAVQLTPLPHVSPTMAARLQVCPLQVACDRDKLIQSMLVKGTSARLGTICHRVLEAVGKHAIQPTADWDAAFEKLWGQEVARMEAEVEQSARDCHLGSPERWPYYAMRRAWLKHTAQDIWSRQGEGMVVKRAPERGIVVAFERRYTAFEGRMRGTADVVRQIDGELVIEDYKTGAILEAGGERLAPKVRESYRQQLLLYAAMHHNTEGVWPKRARLIPLEGEPVDIAIDPQEASALAMAALTLLDTYNAALAAGRDPRDLACPGQDTCKWCGYHGVCDAVWEAMSPEWEWSYHAVEGLVLAAQPTSRGLTNADVNVERSSVPSGTYRIQTDTPAVGAALVRAQRSRVRITNLRFVGGRLVTTPTSGVWSAQE